MGHVTTLFGRGCVWTCLLAGSLLMSPLVSAQSTTPGADRTACALEAGPSRAVAGVIDSETITLDDGSEVRLIGALAPRPPDAALDVSFWPPEREAKAALERLVLGRSVTLAFAGRRADRYGRTLAHVFVEPDHATATVSATAADERIWVQARMLAEGHARAFVVKDNAACLRELAAHEAIARQAGTGLWANAAYQRRDAGRTQELMRLRSTFQVVEGRVTGVIAGRSALLLRFGPDGAATERTADDAPDARPTQRGFSVAIELVDEPPALAAIEEPPPRRRPRRAARVSASLAAQPE